MSQKSTPRGLKLIPRGLITTPSVPNLTPRNLKSTPRGLKSDYQQTSRGPKQTLRGQNSIPRCQKIDPKMPIIIDSYKPKIDSQSAKSTPRFPKLTFRVKSGLLLLEAQNRFLVAKYLILHAQVYSESTKFEMTGTKGYFLTFGVSRSMLNSFSMLMLIVFLAYPQI